LDRKHPGHHSRKSSTSIEAKLHKIVKSSSSTENPKLETLYSPNKGSPNVIISHEEKRTVSRKVNHHLKCSFGIHENHPQELKSYLMQ
jgi:hypothetical protein